MKYLYYNSTLILTGLIIIVSTLLKLYQIIDLKWLLLLSLIIFTISLILKIFRSIKINNTN